MVLEGHFYTVDTLERTEKGFKAQVNLVYPHPVYEGHFPQQPIVPGVCTLQIIKECLAQVLGLKCIFSKIVFCKFVSALIPGVDDGFMVDVVLGENGRLQAEVKTCQRMVMILKAHWEETHGKIN